MSLYLALHVNGVKTECLIADETQVLAQRTGEGLPSPALEPQVTGRRLVEALTAAGEQAGVPLYLVTRACVALEALGAPGVRSWAESLLGELLTGELRLVSEEEAALEAAFGRGPGVLVMAGAGSQVVARCGDGSRFKAGGWGAALGEEGSLGWIGREGLRSGLRALDRGLPGSLLLKEVGAVWGINGSAALKSRASQIPLEDFAALAEVVGRGAASGDALSRSVLEHAGEELAAQVSTVLFRMRGASCAAGDGLRVAYTGEVMERLPAVLNAMVNALRSVHPQVAVDGVAVVPVEGALARARRES